jgi:hypothetical protein
VNAYYRVTQKLLCSKVPSTTLQFFLQQMLGMYPKGLTTCLDTLLHWATGVLSSGPWGTFPTSAVGRTATWYLVLYCTVTFGTLCTFSRVLQFTTNEVATFNSRKYESFSYVFTPGLNLYEMNLTQLHNPSESIGRDWSWWLTRARDSTCVEASETQAPYSVSHIYVHIWHISPLPHMTFEHS